MSRPHPAPDRRPPDPVPDFAAVHGREAGTWSVRDPETHGRRVRAMFARISGVYDFMNHLLSFNRDKVWRRRLVRRIDDGPRTVLDLCAGTCDLALAGIEAGKGSLWLALDFCPEMLRGADRKTGADRLHRTAADALRLPLRDACVDVVTVGFGVRNFADVRLGLGEIARVLRPGGQVLVLDFFRDDPSARGHDRGLVASVRVLVATLVRGLGRLVGRDGAAYAYLPSSRDHFLTPAEFRGLLEDSGFARVQVERQTFGIAHAVAGRRV